MVAVDKYIKNNSYWKYTDEFKSYKYLRLYPHPLFTQDTTEIYNDEGNEKCPCCIDKDDISSKLKNKFLVSPTV